ncbi:flagellar motor stator protein MotA [Teichococcus cervicalis]|uniref:Flagellar motor stator protein MotA n=1 Tax=Pseudoroseomonas cervicalis ATCC 49957 TaxID=525371 RepID=D5RG29_9PROT|nr:flagellar motor stator protein MotA [Pseudoroseomonas cervicalis]EFH13739.1 flagellar motor stator protein MotA [Pseudoroseomonas cervicalis ATCC 49957]
MIQIVGILGVFVAVFGGYLIAGGKMGVILGALGPELMIIGGSGFMTLLIGGDMALVTKTMKSFGKVFKGPSWNRKDFSDLLCLLYLLLRTHQKEGAAKLEKHIEKPEASAIFSRYPRLLRDPALSGLICDTLRTITLNNKDPHRVGEMMETAIEKRHSENIKPAKAIQTMADAFPALGIVAAVLGVIKAMGAISESPEVLGRMIGAALVGTFLGVFLSYGLVGPMSGRLKLILEEERKMLDVTRAVITSYLENLSPQICVEVGRQSVPSKLQPSFDQMEEQLREAGRVKTDGEAGGG